MSEDELSDRELLREGNALRKAELEQRKAELEQRKAEFEQRQRLVKIALGSVLGLVTVALAVYGLAQIDLPWRHAIFFASALMAFLGIGAACTEDGVHLFWGIPAAFVAALTYPWW